MRQKKLADLRLVHSNLAGFSHRPSSMRILFFLCLLVAVVVAKKDLKKLQIGVKVIAYLVWGD